ncbi:MAG TPA: histidine phosphatase family protein [Candidatus Limnocylindrales bacterium]|nr:histidine phosphatase family protein [Candidatus Limnocylindrales bacterium]
MGKVSSKISRRKSKPSPPTRLLLVRHAEIERRFQHAFGGRIDMNLSPHGRAQARTLANFLRAKNITAIYASPLKRVQQTLAPFLKNGAPEQTILPGLQEVDFGDWSGYTWTEVREKFGVHPYDWLDEIELGAVPNGENGVQFRARVEACLFKIIRRHPGEMVAIFTHGGVIRMMLSILLDLPLPKTNSFEIEYTSVTQVALHTELNEIELLNFTPWRDCSR